MVKKYARGILAVLLMGVLLLGVASCGTQKHYRSKSSCPNKI